MVPLTDERDVDTLRQISRLLDRENQRLIEKVRQLTAELARLRGTPHAEQLALALRDDLARARAQILAGRADAVTPPPPPRTPQPGHGPRPQPALPIVESLHTLPPDHQDCPACGGTLTAMPGQYETSERITTATARW
jgi:transposase